MRQHFILFFIELFWRVYLESLEFAMRRLVLAEGDRCDDGGRVQLQRDVLGRVVGRTACRPGCCPAGRRLRS